MRAPTRAPSSRRSNSASPQRSRKRGDPIRANVATGNSEGTSTPRSTIVLALLAVYLFWGSTAPAMKVAVASVPPFEMAAVRFFCAGALLWMWSRARGVALPSARDWRDAAVSGTLFLVLGNAVFAWSLQYLPGGLASLFFALTPMWNALFAAVIYRERMSPFAIAGIVLGLGGLIYLVAPSGAQHLPLWASLVAMSCSIVWSIGSMLQRRFPRTNVMQMSAMQMLVAFAELCIVAPLGRERFVAANFTPSAIGAIAFLVVFGSIVGFSAYVWLTRTQSTALASTNSYVNPVVSIAIGVGFLGETISASEVVATLVVLVGVALMLVPWPARSTRVAPAAD